MKKILTLLTLLLIPLFSLSQDKSDTLNITIGGFYRSVDTEIILQNKNDVYYQFINNKFDITTGFKTYLEYRNDTLFDYTGDVYFNLDLFKKKETGNTYLFLTTINGRYFQRGIDFRTYTGVGVGYFPFVNTLHRLQLSCGYMLKYQDGITSTDILSTRVKYKISFTDKLESNLIGFYIFQTSDGKLNTMDISGDIMLPINKTMKIGLEYNFNKDLNNENIYIETTQTSFKINLNF